MQLIRDRNEICRRHALPVEHDDVPPLGRDTGARFMVEYFEREVKRLRGETLGPRPEIIAPGIDAYYQPWTLEEALKAEGNADLRSMFGPAIRRIRDGKIDYNRQRRDMSQVHGRTL